MTSMTPAARRWTQRAVVVGVWVTLLLLWRRHQSRNDLSTTEAGQEFIDAIDGTWWGVAAFVGVYLLRPLVLFPASVITVMAGVLFGPWVGVAVVVVAANASAMVAYGVGWMLGRPPGELTADGAGLVDRWTGRLRDHEFETVFVMRLLFLPYDLVNYACGALRVRWTSFLLATALGSLPGTISFVLLGASLERVDEGLDGINPWAVVASVAIFAASVAVSRLVRRRTDASEATEIAPPPGDAAAGALRIAPEEGTAP